MGMHKHLFPTDEEDLKAECLGCGITRLETMRVIPIRETVPLSNEAPPVLQTTGVIKPIREHVAFKSI